MFWLALPRWVVLFVGTVVPLGYLTLASTAIVPESKHVQALTEMLKLPPDEVRSAQRAAFSAELPQNSVLLGRRPTTTRIGWFREFSTLSLFHRALRLSVLSFSSPLPVVVLPSLAALRCSSFSRTRLLPIPNTAPASSTPARAIAIDPMAAPAPALVHLHSCLPWPFYAVLLLLLPQEPLFHYCCSRVAALAPVFTAPAAAAVFLPSCHLRSCSMLI